MIVAQNIGKQYVRYHPQRPTTLVETFVQGIQRFRPAKREWALRDVSLTIAPGRTVGLLGANGAGKSTLLRLLGGISRPDEGTLHVQGRIGALLDLGAGFHPDLTGRENVFITGVIAGLTRREVAARFDAIVDFAELADYMDDPLRTYSTGMQMRLAFAVASHIDPEVLLIDEVLAVGDIAFQQKCLARIQQFKTQGCTIVLVTHEPGLVERLCDEAIWLDAGHIAAQGNAKVVAGHYVAAMHAVTRQRTPVDAPPTLTPTGVPLTLNENRFGSQEMTITQVHLLNSMGQKIDQLISGEALSVRIRYHAPTPTVAPIFGLTLMREDGLICYETSTEATALPMPTLTGDGEIILEIQRLDLAKGDYYLDVGIYEKAWRYAYDYHWHVYPLAIHSVIATKGILQPPHYWRLGGAVAPMAALHPNGHLSERDKEQQHSRLTANPFPVLAGE